MRIRRFRTRREVERYFGGQTIRCLLCGGRFRRLAAHLAKKHSLRTDAYKARFGLPWYRGLTSALSRANSGWNDQRRAKQSRLALKTKFFRLAGPRRRELAPFLKVHPEENLGVHAVGYGKDFERRVRALFNRGLCDGDIAERLGVGRMTVNLRTRRWRNK
jgi:hypothetical protein